MTQFEIIEGVKKTPSKILLYGSPGSGKTTFLSGLENAIIADVEKGSHAINCKRIEINNAQQLFDALKWFKETKFDSIVIDTFTKVQTYLADDVLRENNWKNLEAPGYGKGYEVLKQKIISFIKACDWLTANGKNVFVIAHSRIKTFYDPMLESYDRYEPDILKQGMPEIIAAFDAVLFLKKKTIVKTIEGGDHKNAIAGKDRILYANEQASFVAKNRYNLADSVTNPNAKEYFNDIL